MPRLRPPLILLTCLLALAVATEPAQAQTFKVLHTFHGWNGAEPVGVLVRDGSGNIYGTTGVGGSGKCQYGCGTAFKIDSAGKQVWLHSFSGWNGYIPYAGLLRDSTGHLFGTTAEGGDTSCDPPYGCGTVFKLNATTGNETVLHKFMGPPDGWGSDALMIRNTTGNLYGTTYYGGSDSQGTVFMIDTVGKETILHSFAGPPSGGGDGAWPYAGVVRDATGNLYGVTFAGGAYGAGAVYKVNSRGDETLLYSFNGSSDGAQPISKLLLDSAGNLYGTTENGGNGQCGGTGCGVVFKLSPQSGGGWTETLLYAFCSLALCADGESPDRGPLVMDAAQNIYGTTYFGGVHRNCNGDGCGVVFKLDTSGREAVLHSFTGGTDGALPVGGLAIDKYGNLYGTTQEGGDLNCQPNHGGCGVVFKITP